MWAIIIIAVVAFLIILICVSISIGINIGRKRAERIALKEKNAEKIKINAHVCPNCGANIMENQKFCISCGKKID